MAESINFFVNGARRSVNATPDRSLLTVLRDELDLTGTHYGCGEGQCGACTVHINGSAARSCLTKLSSMEGRQITTVEGLAQNGRLHPLQDAFLETGAFQCGYCTSGMLLSAAALLSRNTNPSDADIFQAMQGNICRCGMFRRIKEAIHLAASRMRRPG